MCRDTLIDELGYLPIDRKGADLIFRVVSNRYREDPVEERRHRSMEPSEGTTPGTPSPESVSTKLKRIAELAKKAPGMAFTTLAHHIDVDFLRVAYALTRKDGAPGVDGQTAKSYEKNLEANLRSLLERFKSGIYQAPPVKRLHIPKGEGTKTRPILGYPPSRTRSFSVR